jgi:hypothetical protein
MLCSSTAAATEGRMSIYEYVHETTATASFQDLKPLGINIFTSLNDSVLFFP